MAFTEFGSYLQYLRFDSVNIDNNVFRLHYKITCMVFLCSSALTLMGQYIGDPIDCMVDGIPGGMMDTYCWIHSTFSIPSRYVISIELFHNTRGDVVLFSENSSNHIVVNLANFFEFWSS